ncbi:MAG: hypothetical protein JZU65_09830 [Chlorobium sp.]|jgi:hypothetical protein|nr:hypothetical protein [Chlorobium sp.]
MLSETERHNVFRQIRSSIQNSEQYLIAGIDIAKEKHHAFFGTAAGKTMCKRLIFSNDISGFELLVAQVLPSHESFLQDERSTFEPFRN